MASANKTSSWGEAGESERSFCAQGGDGTSRTRVVAYRVTESAGKGIAVVSDGYDLVPHEKSLDVVERVIEPALQQLMASVDAHDFY